MAKIANRNYGKAAAVYARTLLELSSEKGIQAALKTDMEILRDVFEKTPELDRALGLHALSAEKKAMLAKPLSENSSEILKRLIRLLEIKGRLALLGSICEEFLRLEEAGRHVRRARVISALPLTTEQLEQLSQGLSARSLKSGTRQTYLLHNEVDPSLIAGFRVEEDDSVIDASLRHKLNALRHNLAA